MIQKTFSITFAICLATIHTLFSQSVGGTLFDALTSPSGGGSSYPQAQLVSTNYCKQAANTSDKFVPSFSVVNKNNDSLKMECIRDYKPYSSTFTKTNKNVPVYHLPLRVVGGSTTGCFSRTEDHFIYFIDSVNCIVVINNVEIYQPRDDGKDDGIYYDNGIRRSHIRMKRLKNDACPDSLIWAYYTLDKDKKKVKKLISAQAKPEEAELKKALAFCRQHIQEEEASIVAKHTQEIADYLKGIKNSFNKKLFKPENLLLKDPKAEQTVREWWKEHDYYNTKFTLVKLVWIDKAYKVIKNDYSLPTCKVKDVVLVMKENTSKKCFAMLQRVGLNYEGAGTYGTEPSIYNSNNYYSYEVNISIGGDYIYEIDCLK